MIVAASRLAVHGRVWPPLVFGVLAITAGGDGHHTLRSTTEGATAPLVLEPGLGESASAMSRWIAPDVARTPTVCVDDRAGHGHSDAARSGRAVDDVVRAVRRARG